MQVATLDSFDPFISCIKGTRSGDMQAKNAIVQNKTEIIGVLKSKIKQPITNIIVNNVFRAVIFKNIVLLFKSILLK